jgi:hypothetical protein
VGEERCARHCTRCQDLFLVAKCIVCIDAVILHDKSAPACCEALLFTHPQHHMFGLATVSDPDPELLGKNILTYRFDDCSVYRFHPDRIVAVFGVDRSRIITGGMLHQRGEHVGRQFSRNPWADVAEDQLAKFAEWLHSGALLSVEAVYTGTV